MVDVRELVVRISAVDTATPAIRQINNAISRINDDINIQIKSTVSPVENSLSAVESSISDVNDTIAETTESFTDFESSIEDNTKNINNDINTVSNTLTNLETTANTVSSTVSGIFEAVGGAARAMGEEINNAINGIKAGNVAVGVATTLVSQQAFRDVMSDEALAEQLTSDQYQQAMKWASKGQFASSDQRATYLSNLLKRGLSLDEAMKFGEATERLRFSRIATLGGRSIESVASELNMVLERAQIKGGKVQGYRLDRQLKELGLHAPTEEEIKAATSAVKGTAEWERTYEITDSTARKKAQDRLILNEAIYAQIRAMEGVDMAHLSYTQRLELLKIKLDELKDAISSEVVPVLIQFVDAIARIVNIILKIPGAVKIIGLVTAFTILAAVVSQLSLAFNQMAAAATRAMISVRAYEATMRGEAVTNTMGGARVPAALQKPLRRVGVFLEEAGIMARTKQIEGAAPVPLPDRGLIDRMKATWGNAMLGGSIRAVPRAIFETMKTGFAGVAQSARVAVIAVMNFGRVLLALAIVNPLGAIIAAVVTITVLIVSLAWKFGYLQRAWERFKESAIGKDLIDAFYHLLSILDYVGAYLGAVWRILGRKVGGGLITFLDTVADRAGKIFNALDKTYSGFKSGGDIKMVLSGGRDLIKALNFVPLINLLDLILDCLADVFDKISHAGDIIDWVKNWLIGAWSLIESLPSRAWSFIQRLPSLFWQFLSQLPGMMWEKIKELPGIIWDNTKKIPGMIWEKIKNLSRDIAIFILEGLSKIPMIGDKVLPYLQELKRQRDEERAKEKESEEGNTGGSNSVAGTSTRPSSSTSPLYPVVNPTYGITGWGAGENRGKIGLLAWSINPRVRLDAATQKAVDAAIRDANQNKGNTLRGEQWMIFQQKYPEYVQYMHGNTAIFVTPEEAAERYGVPESELPPESATVDALRSGKVPIPGAATGGEVLAKGLMYVHTHEPIVPARIARSSNLIKILEQIANIEIPPGTAELTPFPQSDLITTLSRISSSNVTTNNNSPVYNITYNNTFHFPGVSSADYKTKRELTHLIDEHIEKRIRQRTAH